MYWLRRSAGNTRKPNGGNTRLTGLTPVEYPLNLSWGGTPQKAVLLSDQVECIYPIGRFVSGIGNNFLQTWPSQAE